MIGKEIIAGLRSLRSAVTGARQSLQALQARIEELRQEREALQSAPLAKADVLELLDGWLGSAAAGYPAALERALAPIRARGIAARARLQASPQIFCGPLNAPTRDGAPTDWSSLQAALLYVLGDRIRDAMRQAVGAMDWPEAGPPLAQREARLSEIEAELAQLERDDAELLNELRAMAHGGRDA